MLSSACMLLLSGAFLMLRLGRGAGSFPRPLTREEERGYVERAMAGDMEARNKLIEHNLRLVAHIVKKYYTQPEAAEDLISIGTVGLIKAIDSYSPDRGVRLATYASKCTENEILMYFRSQKKSAGDLSLSDSIDMDGEGNSLSLMDVIAEEDDLAESIGTRELCASLRSKVEAALDPREAQIIKLRYGLGGGAPLTQRETAERCGISRSYVSRIEKKALSTLRRELEGQEGEG